MAQLRNFFDKIHEYFKDYPDWVSESILGLSFGLMFGFLLRILGKYFVLTIAALVISVVVLYYGGFVSFHSQPLMTFFGWTKVPSFQNALTSFWDGMQTHLIAWLISIVGFIIGWKLGG